MGRKVAASITLTERQERTLKKIGTDRRSEHRYHQSHNYLEGSSRRIQPIDGKKDERES